MYCNVKDSVAVIIGVIKKNETLHYYQFNANTISKGEEKMIQQNVLANSKSFWRRRGYQSIFCSGTCKSDR